MAQCVWGATLLSVLLISPTLSLADEKLTVQNLAIVPYDEKIEYGLNGGDVGESLASGDVNGDGRIDVITGAVPTPNLVNQFPNATGTLVVFDVKTGGVIYSIPGSSSYYADAVAFGQTGNQRYLLIGEPSAVNSSQLQVGAAEVRDATTGQLLQKFYGTRDREQYGSEVKILSDGSYAIGAPSVRYAAGANFPGRVEVRNADFSFRFEVFGESNRDRFGQVIVDAGDLNNDTYNEILVSAPDGNGYGGTVILIDGQTGNVLSTKTPTGAQYSMNYGRSMGRVSSGRFAVAKRDGIEIIQASSGGAVLSLVDTITATAAYARPNVFTLTNGNILEAYPTERNPNTNIDRVGLVRRYNSSGALLEQFYGDTINAELGHNAVELETGVVGFGEANYSSPRIQVVDLDNSVQQVGMRCRNFIPLAASNSLIQLDTPAQVGGDLVISGRIESPIADIILLNVGFLRPDTSTGRLGNGGCRVAFLSQAFATEETNIGPNGEFSFSFPIPSTPHVEGLTIAAGAVAVNSSFTAWETSPELRVRIDSAP